MSEWKNPAADIIENLERVNDQRRRLTLGAIVLVAALSGAFLGFGLDSIGAAEKEVRLEAAELATVHSSSDAYRGLLEHYRASLPGTAQTLFAALIAREEGEFATAAAVIEQVASSETPPRIALAYLGELKLTSDKHTEAIDHLEAALHMAEVSGVPESVDVDAEFNLGLAYLARAAACRDHGPPEGGSCSIADDEREARDAFSTAIALKPALIDLAVADGVRDFIEDNLGRAEVAAIRRGLKVKQLIALGLQAVRAGDRPEVIRLYREVLEVADPASDEHRTIEGWLAYHYRKQIEDGGGGRDATRWLTAYHEQILAADKTGANPPSARQIEAAEEWLEQQG